MYVTEPPVSRMSNWPSSMTKRWSGSDESASSSIICTAAAFHLKPRRKPVFICHDLTKETRRYLVDDLADVVIDQNARLIAEQSVIRLLGSIASSAPYLTKKFIEPRLILKENVPVQ